MCIASLKSQELVRDGFTILRKAVDESRLKEINNFFSSNLSYFSGNDPFDEFGLSHDVQNGILFDVYQRYPVFRPLAETPIIGEVLSNVIGKHIFLYENSLVYAPKYHSTDVPWHQDFQDRPEEPIKYIAFIALDSLQEGSGALKIIKKSHEEGFIPYRTKGDKGHHTGIPEENYGELDLALMQTINQAPGDIILFNQLVVHSISPWSSDSLGRGVRFSYQGFDRMYTPRLSPITIFGGSPSEFPNAYTKSSQLTKASLKARLKNKLRKIFG